MHRGFLGLLCSVTLLAQVPQQSPIDAAVQESWNARSNGHFEIAAAKREEARSLLAQTPPSAPQFANWSQIVISLYQSAGMYARARSVAEDGLARGSSLSEGDPARILLLNTLAALWQEDRNPLKAIGYLEKAVAAQEAVAAKGGNPAPGNAVGDYAVARLSLTPMPASRLMVYQGNFSSFGGRRWAGQVSDTAGAYQRLAEAYRLLGRPDAAAAAMAKVKSLSSGDSAGLATYYEREGKIDDAAAIYQQQVSQSADGQQKANSLQQLAFLYERQQRHEEAAAVLEQALVAAGSSGDRMARNQLMSLRQNLAGLLRQAGKIEKADQLYQQILADNQDDPDRAQALMNYAQYLNSTERGAQAETLLKEYLDGHPQMEPWQQANLLFNLAASARQAGSPDRAKEYQKAAEQKNRPADSEPNRELLTDLLQRAQSAANAGKMNEAFSLALQALEAAPRSRERDQIAWQIPSLANLLAAKNAPAQADQLYRQLFVLAENWSEDTLQPWLSGSQTYVRFLMSGKDRMSETPDAIERYRAILIRARGPNTGMLADALHMTIDFERSHDSPKRALLAAQDLLAMQEGLSGATGEPVVEALGTLASLYEMSGDSAHALPFERRSVSIADLVYPASDVRRAMLRMQVALSLARQGQFDDADKVSEEAAAIVATLRPPQPGMLNPRLEEIKRLKTGKPATTTPNSKWFNKGDPGLGKD